jgi:hypothetical protein
MLNVMLCGSVLKVLLAMVMISRSVPAPLSAALVTVRLSGSSVLMILRQADASEVLPAGSVAGAVMTPRGGWVAAEVDGLAAVVEDAVAAHGVVAAAGDEHTVAKVVADAVHRGGYRTSDLIERCAVDVLVPDISVP